MTKSISELEQRPPARELQPYPSDSSVLSILSPELEARRYSSTDFSPCPPFCFPTAHRRNNKTCCGVKWPFIQNDTKARQPARRAYLSLSPKLSYNGEG